jgi:hypothetical protein
MIANKTGLSRSRTAGLNSEITFNSVLAERILFAAQKFFFEIFEKKLKKLF